MDKIGWCGWHRTIVNAKQSILVGELQSLTGKWSPCCRKCWNKRQKLNDNIWTGLFKVGERLFDGVSP